MAELIPWPFPLPDRFLDALGYPRVVEAFDSPAMRARLAELLRRQGIDTDAAPPTGPRRFVLFHWQPAGDELAFSDGVHSGAGQLNHWIWLDYLHGCTPGVPPPVLGPIVAWLVEHQVDLGSSDAEATHALIIDAGATTAWVAPIGWLAASSACNRSPRRTEQISFAFDPTFMRRRANTERERRARERALATAHGLRDKYEPCPKCGAPVGQACRPDEKDKP